LNATPTSLETKTSYYPSHQAILLGKSQQI